MPATQGVSEKILETTNAPTPALGRYFSGHQQALSQFADLSLASKRAFHIRMKTLESLDKHLLDFEGHFNKHQGKVLWAPNAEAARQEIGQIAGPHGRLLYGRNHLAGEIELDKIKSAQVYCVDGEQANNRSHWVFPGWNGEKPAAIPEHLHITSSDAAVLFPEFLVSENGSMSLAFNHPDIGKLIAHCNTLIFVAGIEQVIPSTSDLELLLSLLSTYQYGIKNHTYYLIEQGYQMARNLGVKKEIYVLLLDNGRTNLLSAVPQRQALYCVRCGACMSNSNITALKTDPGSPRFPGIIGAIAAPFMDDFESNINLSFMYPLSGRATASCPVNIDLKHLILENRREAVKRKSRSRLDSYAWKLWRQTMLSRKWLNQGAGMKNFTLKSFFRKSWGDDREFPKVKDKSFNQWWIENRGAKEN